MLEMERPDCAAVCECKTPLSKRGGKGVCILSWLLDTACAFSKLVNF